MSQFLFAGQFTIEFQSVVIGGVFEIEVFFTGQELLGNIWSTIIRRLHLFRGQFALDGRTLDAKI